MRHGLSAPAAVQGVHLSQETVIFEEPLILLVPLLRFHIHLDQLERWSNTMIPAGVNIGVTSSYMTKKVGILDWWMQATSLSSVLFSRKNLWTRYLKSMTWTRNPNSHLSPQHCFATSSHICSTTRPTRSMAMPKKNSVFHDFPSNG